MSIPKHHKIYFDYFGGGPQYWTACECCEVRGSTEIHHLKYRSQGGKDTPENLAAICTVCHDIIHNRPGGKGLNEVLIKKHLQLYQSKKK